METPTELNEEIAAWRMAKIGMKLCYVICCCLWHKLWKEWQILEIFEVPFCPVRGCGISSELELQGASEFLEQQPKKVAMDFYTDQEPMFAVKNYPNALPYKT